MLRKRWLIVGLSVGLAALFLLALFLQPVQALAYSFEVPREVVNLFVNADGTVTLEYTIDFKNAAGASAIDFVDLGLPNKKYNLKNITAEVNGVAIRDIQNSEYVQGAALGLGTNSIKAGQTGQVHAVVKNIPGMFYKGKTDTKEAYASFQFSPNWFDSKFARGTTNLTVNFYLPAGMKAEEPIYFKPKSWPGAEKPESSLDNQGRVLYRWQASNANAYTQYSFGAAFPSRLLPANTIQTEPLFTEDQLIAFFTCGGMGTFFALIIGLSVSSQRKRKMQYLPPKLSIEGHGIKRGLTAIEAAVLMEQPVDKVMTMMLFSVVKKGAARVTSKDPIKLEVFPVDSGVLQPYEEDFLKAMKEENTTDKRTGLRTMMVSVIRSVTEKMRGFSRKETLAYYKDIQERAWQQVEAAGTPEMQMKAYDEAMGWTMLDKDFGDHTRRVFGPRPVIVPTWWMHVDPGIPHTGSSIPSGGGSMPVSMPTLPGADFAASVVNGMQSFSAGVIGDVTDFASGVTNQTNPVPVSSSSGGSSGGGGCACACACAGCACACAGGGR